MSFLPIYSLLAWKLTNFGFCGWKPFNPIDLSRRHKWKMKLLFQTFLCYNADYVGGDGEDEGTVYIRTLRPYSCNKITTTQIQIMGGTICSRCKGKTLLGIVNKLLEAKSLLTSPSNVLPYYLKETFPLMIWIFTEVEGDGIKSRLSS